MVWHGMGPWWHGVVYAREANTPITVYLCSWHPRIRTTADHLILPELRHPLQFLLLALAVVTVRFELQSSEISIVQTTNNPDSNGMTTTGEEGDASG